MIEPFVDAQKREGVISYGLSSYGYDARVGNDFKIFTNVNQRVVDPKNFDQQQLRRPQHRRLHHPAQLLRAGAHGRIFPHPARRAGDLRRQVDLCALRHHRERDAARAGVGRPRDAGVLQHHAAARQASTPTRAPASSCSCRATSPARSPTATRPASTRASAASPCPRSERRRPWIASASRAAASSRATIRISGSKNAALPLMVAALLSDKTLDAAQRAAAGRHHHHDPAAAAARRRDRARRRRERPRPRHDAHAAGAARSPRRRRPTTSCARCAPRCWCWARCWRATARRASRCPAAAPSARGRSTCTSPACEAMGAEIDIDGGYIVATRAQGPEGRALSPSPRCRSAPPRT